MKIFKFGGASVKNADGVRNVASILKLHENERIIVVISAMDKTTNLLERLVSAYMYDTENPFLVLEEVKNFHLSIVKELINDEKNSLYNDLDNLFLEIECLLEKKVGKDDYDFIYDQIVSYGEFISTRIISSYLLFSGIRNKWVDARNFIITDSNFREGKVLWEETRSVVSNKLKPFAEKSMVITQGFIGKDKENATTTLGREGSDYSAAIFAYCLDAESVTIWKDVAGVMNADPKKFGKAIKLDNISYKQAIELAYYGASVIHPKTIQPLQAKHIPLYVKSFIDPSADGTIVGLSNTNSSNIPCYIFKENQALISIASSSFSFIVEENLKQIFDIISKHKIRVNVMQNSAISFSISVDFHKEKINRLVSDLSSAFRIEVIEGLKLITIYNTDNSEAETTIIGNQEILMEQKLRNVHQYVIKI